MTTSWFDSLCAGLWVLLLLTVGLLFLAACATDTSYNQTPSGKWSRSDCQQSDKEYRLFDRQWHCTTVPVTADEAAQRHR